MSKIILIIGVCCVLPSIVFGIGYEDMAYGMSYGGIQAIGDKYSSGYKSSYEDKHYPPHPYKFGYNIKDGYGGSMNQKEEGDDYGNKKGSYGYVDSYGIYRQVDYVADKHGFRATIKTNEPGTANQNPAAVYIHSEAAHYDSGISHGNDYYSPKHSSMYGNSLPIYKAASNSVPITYAKPAENSGFYKSSSEVYPSNNNIKQLYAIPSKESSEPKIYKMPATYLAPKTIKIYKGLPIDNIHSQYGQQQLYKRLGYINQKY